MTKHVQLISESKEISVDHIVQKVRELQKQSLQSPSAEAVRFCTGLSQALLDSKEAQKYPELQTLAFWLRPASHKILLERFLPDHIERSPVGVVFILPPSNVPTLFGYLSVIALLSGNTCLVRLPSSPHPVQIILTSLIQEILPTFLSLRERLIILRYNHDDEITAQLSSVCNLRLAWGSDETVDHIAKITLPRDAKHISFGDRFSAAAIKIESYLALDAQERDQLLRKIYNDIYLFDQMACSSPRLIVWGGKKDGLNEAKSDFYGRLSEQTKAHHYQLGAGESIAKLNATYLALYDLAPTSYKNYNPQLTTLTLPNLDQFSNFKRINFGYGLLPDVYIEKLDDFAAYTEPHDQTLVCFGFSPSEIEKFQKAQARLGFDRIVEPGQALTFDPFW
ncbi:MAG: acyl-CoA reductase, partial [Alphaproteobacteria bacterium]